MKKKKILILGSSGFLGKTIYKNIKKEFIVEHTGIKKRAVDFNNVFQFKRLIENNKFDFIINCVGFTDIDKCQIKRDEALNLNFKLVKNILNIKKFYKLKFNFIHFSTDQVYNKNDTSSYSNEKNISLKNVNYYTYTKLIGEKICSNKNKYNSLIFRTNFIGKSFSKKKSFTDWLAYSIKNNHKIMLAKDSYFTPLKVETIALIIKKIIKLNKFKPGIYNLGSRKGLSKLDVGKFFIDKLNKQFKNYSIKNINEITKTRRSKNMMMNVSKFSKTFKIKLPTLTEELKSLIKDYEN
jgi:dTDP-4-dehydrorhamnose reductase